VQCTKLTRLTSPPPPEPAANVQPHIVLRAQVILLEC
jgi:hypothetical protein